MESRIQNQLNSKYRWVVSLQGASLDARTDVTALVKHRGGGMLSYSGNREPIMITGDPFWLPSDLPRQDLTFSTVLPGQDPCQRHTEGNQLVSRGEVVETARGECVR